MLESYAARGVFRSFSQTSGADEVLEYRFRWLWSLPFHITFDARRGLLSFKRLLPQVPAGSDIDTGLRAFLAGFQSPERSEHRRIDPARVAVQYSNRRGAVSLAFRVAGNHYEYGVRKAMQVVNEVFLGFLNFEHPQYLAEHFRIPED